MLNNLHHEPNNIIFYEMMSHPALFMHPAPKKIVIIGDDDNAILQQALKHGSFSEINIINKNGLINSEAIPYIKHYSSDSADWLKKITPQSIDILIHAAMPAHHMIMDFFNLLGAEGILVQQSVSPFDISALNLLVDQFHAAGFKDQQILHFPQPTFPSGWRAIIMAAKQGKLKRVREKEIFAKSFRTYYYNLDTHKAAFVLPEFMREECIA